MKNADSNENRVNDKVTNLGSYTPDSTEKRLEKLEDQTKQMSEKLENMESDIQANKREVQYAINKLYSVRDINGLSDGSVSDN
jgi:chaperonin cofactor prefoldin